MKRAGSRFGLMAKLLALLLAFGVVPLGLVITIGYTVSRSVVTEQAENALRELALMQAVHIATELTRQRLLLRTITGQLPKAAGPAGPAGPLSLDPRELSRLLESSLPEDGVFDGLRLVNQSSGVVASVALSTAAPHWPTMAPSADWANRSIVVHREGGRVLAYVIAAPVGDAFWLEGHVPSDGFLRLFSMPTHMIGTVEAAIVDERGAPVVVGHEHAEEDLVRAFETAHVQPETVVRAGIDGRLSLVTASPVSGTDWVFIAALPLEVALTPLARVRNTSVLATGVLVFLIILTGVLAARTVTTPLSELAREALHFGRAGVYRSLVPRTRDEVGLLVKSFNRMAEDLERSRREIDEFHKREMERAQQLATVGELASGVAHEIRNPVTGVMGALDLALQKIPEGGGARPLLEEAQNQLKRIEAITAQFLQYARPPELRQVVVDVSDIVDRAARVVEGRTHGASVQLKIEPTLEAIAAEVDPELIVQVLVNLMLNGIEATEPGGELTVWVSRHDPEVWIGVRDRGPGIPMDMRYKVFRPFFTTKHRGTGLGLSISRQIVDRHGGSLRLEDTPGGGTTFVVSLPLFGKED